MSLYLDGTIDEAYIGRFKLRSIWIGKKCLHKSDSTFKPEPYLPNEYLYFKATNGPASIKFDEGIATATTGGVTPVTIDRTQFVNYRAPVLEYSFDKTIWVTYPLGTIINLAPNRKVYFRGNNDASWFDQYTTSYSETSGESTSSYTHYHYIWFQLYTVSGQIKGAGNVLSLRDKSLSDITNIPCDYAFTLLFRNCTGLLQAPVLSATTLQPYCYGGGILQNGLVVRATYGGMFSGCTSLITAPNLPAHNLANYCYASMFYGCTNLTEAPALSATTLTSHCYAGMFSECTNLIEAPVLPATTMVEYCYAGMFYKCTNLAEAPQLPATTLAPECYGDSDWLYTLYGGMFGYCTSLTKTPNLPATTLANYCYSGMFRGCTGLQSITKLPATTLVEGCYYHMFKDIKANSSSASPCTNAYRIPSAGTGTTSSDYYKDLEEMFSNNDGTASFTPSVNTTFYISVPSF
jgi:hypothetical protein